MEPTEIEIEIASPPEFEPSQKVRSLTAVRNDGSYPGAARGEVLVEVGDLGYVQSIGEFLNRYYIYAVDFFERGRIVGMRRGEIESAES